jgi:hypothetical protein
MTDLRVDYQLLEAIHASLGRLAGQFEHIQAMQDGYNGAMGSDAIAGADGSAPVTLDGAHAARIERAAAPDPAHGVDHGARHVDYAVLVPGGAHRWLVFAFLALGAGDSGDEFAGILVGLFDAIMSTFRWTWSNEKTPE